MRAKKRKWEDALMYTTWRTHDNYHPKCYFEATNTIEGRNEIGCIETIHLELRERFHCKKCGKLIDLSK